MDNRERRAITRTMKQLRQTAERMRKWADIANPASTKFNAKCIEDDLDWLIEALELHKEKSNEQHAEIDVPRNAS